MTSNNSDFFRTYFATENLKSAVEQIKIGEGISHNFKVKYSQSIPGIFKPDIELHKNALVLPYISDTHVNPSKNLESVIYSRQGEAILLGNHFKKIYVNFSEHPQKNSYKVIKDTLKEAMYCGVFMPHYGHFILETLPRLWPLISSNKTKYSSMKLIFNLFNFDRTKNITVDSVFESYYGEYFRALGIYRENVIFVDAPISVEDLHIVSCATSLSNVDCFASSEARNVWNFISRAMANKSSANYEKV